MSLKLLINKKTFFVVNLCQQTKTQSCGGSDTLVTHQGKIGVTIYPYSNFDFNLILCYKLLPDV